MVIFHLLVAHLMGDFVFQPNSLIKKKYKSPLGTFEHVLIIVFFTTMMLYPFWQHQWTWITLGTIFGVHFVQDVLKVEYDKTLNPKNKTFPFYLDQIFHISLILLMSKGFIGLPHNEMPALLEWFFFSKEIMIFLVGSILLSYTWDITAYQYKRKKNKKAVYKPDYNGMASRVTLFALFFIVFVFLYKL